MEEGNTKCANPASLVGSGDSASVTTSTLIGADTEHVTSQNAMNQDEPRLELPENELSKIQSMLLKRLDWLRVHVPGDSGNHEAAEVNMDAMMAELEQIDLGSQDSEGQEFCKVVLIELMAIIEQDWNQTGDQTSSSFTLQLLDRGAMLVARTDATIGGEMLANLASLHLWQYQEFGSPDNLTCAVESHARSVSLGKTGIEDLATILGTQGIIYYDQFDDSGMMEDIERAIDCNVYAVSLTPEGNPDLPSLLSNLGIAHLRRFERLGEEEDMNSGIECQTRAVLLTPESDPEMPSLLNNLAGAHQSRFERLGNMDDIEKYIECQTHAVSLTPEGHPDMPIWLQNLGNAHRSRFERLGKIDDIDKSIECKAHAVSLTPKSHPDMPGLLDSLGNSYQSRFERLGNMDDIEKSIEHHTDAVSLAPKGHPQMPIWLNNLGSAHYRRFEQLGKKEDIEKTIECHTHAISLTAKGHPRMPVWQNNLGIAHQSRFELLGKMEDIDKSIEFHTCAVSLTPEGHPRMSDWLTSLGNSHQSRFVQLGKFEDSDKSIESHTRAVSLTPEDHPSRPTRLNNLGIAHLGRFDRLGKLEDLDSGVEYLACAVLLTPEGHPDIPSILSNLGGVHLRRFERLGKVDDINKSIEYHTRAASLTPKDHPAMPKSLNNLGGAHRRRFEQLGEMEDIDNSIDFHTRAVSLTPEGHLDMPGRLNNLGDAYQSRFERLGTTDDVEKSIQYHIHAISLTPEGHPHMPNWLTSLGNSHQSRFELLEMVEDSDKSIESQTRAVSLTPEGHPEMPTFLNNLGHAYLTRSRLTGDIQTLAQSLECFQKCSQTSTGSPIARFHAARKWAELASMLDNSNSDQISAYRVAMNLVPEVIWLGETIVQRYADVQTIGDTVLQAAAAAIHAQEYASALEWLEQGRSVVWNQVLQLRNPFDKLSVAYPLLAANLQVLSFQLHNAGSSPVSLSTSTEEPLSLEEAARKHRKLAGQYDTLLEHIRSLPGFETFLRPRKTSELLPAAQTNPLVVINVHKYRCDALVLLPGKPDIGHIPLPDLTADKIANAFSQLQKTLELCGVRDRTGLRKPDVSRMYLWRNHFSNVLRILWSAVAKPVLEFLGYLSSTPGLLPRITWCTTGTLALLPLHAAGQYDQPGEKLPDYAISSYTPTISALLHARPSTATMHSRLLAIGQEDTPGQGRLPGTRSELDAIEVCAQPPLHYMRVEDSEATRATVLDAIEEYDWVHLACHAHQNVYDPTESGFFLHDEMLSLATITQKSFKNKGLAFLSACQTATGDKKLADEAVHLASGMMMAGYPSVIATMWSVMDADAPIIAKEVYGRLLKDGKMDYRSSAWALHEAVAQLRAKVGDKAFERWAPYIHIGI